MRSSAARRRLVLVGVAAVVACVAGCATDDPPPGADAPIGRHDGGGGTVDGPITGDVGVLPSALSVVVSKITLPLKGGDFAVDLDNDGIADNHVGRMLAALASANPVLDLQTQLETQMAAGNLLLLFELRARALDNSSPVTLSGYYGRDTDGDASNNFSGSATLGLDAKSPTTLRLVGRISSGGLMVGPGELSLPIPLGETTAQVRTKLTQVDGTVSASGIKGIVAGAITVADMQASIVPTLAKEMDRQYKSGKASPQGIEFLRNNFDLDKDGNITVTELSNNPIIGLLLKTADVDTDGDGTKDAMSIALSFEAVPCTIQGKP